MTKRPALVIGQAICWEDDLAALAEIMPLEDFDVIAVNGAGWNYTGRIEWWVSVHGAHLRSWIPRRRHAGGNEDYVAVGNFSPRQDHGEVIPLQRPNGGGSSGMFAVMFALDRGYSRVVVAGCPMEGNTRVAYHDATEKGEMVTADAINPMPETKDGFAVYRGGWTRNRHQMEPYVRSMSGWTRELLGAPTAEWLAGQGD